MNYPEVTEEQQNLSNSQALGKAIEIIEVFSRIDRDMQMQTLLGFLHIALANSKGHTANIGLVRDKVGVSSASASRNVQAWTETNRYGRQGFMCLESSINPDNKTEKIVSLTKKGEDLVNELKKLLD